MFKETMVYREFHNHSSGKCSIVEISSVRFWGKYIIKELTVNLG